MGKSYGPAEGLQKLTWAQVAQIDKTVAQMCEVSTREGADIEITLVIRKGHPRWIRHPMVSYQLKPE